MAAADNPQHADQQTDEAADSQAAAMAVAIKK
jgi:hypothetical protein